MTIRLVPQKFVIVTFIAAIYLVDPACGPQISPTASDSAQFGKSLKGQSVILLSIPMHCKSEIINSVKLSTSKKRDGTMSPSVKETLHCVMHPSYFQIW